VSNSFYAVLKDGDLNQGRLVKLDLSNFQNGIVAEGPSIMNHFIGKDLLIKISYSTLNYKDALAITSKKKVVNRLPIILGVDLAGEIVKVQSKMNTKVAYKSRFEVGNKVLATGYRLGEDFNGGLSQYQLVDTSSVIRLDQFKHKDAEKKSMMLGTAGLTAMLCVQTILGCRFTKLQKSKYPVAVTGASGGVGLTAVHLLKSLGYKVVAVSTLTEDKKQLLYKYGVDDFIDSKSYITDKKYLKSQRFLGAIDTLGGEVLSELMKDTVYYGCIVSTGMVLGDMFTSSVYPLIIRGIRIVGIESIMTPMQLRVKAWKSLFDLVDFKLISSQITEIQLSQTIETAKLLIDNTVSGRILVNCRR
jgi:acrylyl-CoA reductase (NADPH)